MSSLHEKVSRRRAEESDDVQCVALEPGCPALVVRLWCRVTWVLPWAQLTRARLTPVETGDQLELWYAHCLVVVFGTNLHGLVDDLAAFRVGCLRALPAGSRAPAGVTDAVITRIEVRREEREKPASSG